MENLNAPSQDQLAQEIEETLRVSEEGRHKLALALDRALAELANARDAGSALKGRLAAAETEIKRQAEELARLTLENKRLGQGQAGLDAQRRELDAERIKLLSEVNRAMENAEVVRRDGIEALEQARDLQKKRT